MANKPPAKAKSLGFTQLSRLSRARTKEFSLQSLFKYGYRNKEDVSNLPPNTLVVGSQNVLTNAAERVGIRQGYVLDGAAGNQNTYGIDSSYDFNTHSNGIQNVRKWGTTLDCRYVNPATSAVSWISILSTLLTNRVRFTEFWDFNGEVKNLCLFVNGDNNVWEWTGGVGSYASSTATTITVQGTKSLSQLNFYDTTANLGKMKVIINGTTYSYTAAGTSTSSAYSQTSTNTKSTITPTAWMSQLFTTGASATQIKTSTIKINSLAGGSVTPVITAYLYTDNAGVPGTLVATSTSGIPATYSAGDFNVVFPFNASVSAATNYHLVVQSDQTGDLNTYTGVTAAVGTNRSTDGGVTWGTVNGYLNASITENDVTQQTFVGVSPTPSGMSVGDAVIQAPAVGVAAGAVKSGSSTMPSNFTFDLIATLKNQVYYGSLTNNNVYISKVNNYRDVTYSTPRIVGEGALLTLDDAPVGFSPQDDSIYISAGKSFWYQTTFTLSADLTDETLSIQKLKTTRKQGAQSQELIGKMKNEVIFVSYEPIFNSFGSVNNQLLGPQMVNISDPIKYDMDAYSFTGGQTYYDNYYIYLTVPNMGVVRMYNVEKKYWEAPQVLPFSRFFSLDNGTLMAHSSLTNESYTAFTGYNDNGNPINAIAAFPYVAQEGGMANQKKNFNKEYTEGYIAGNTTLTLTINFDFGGFTNTYNVNIVGSNASIIFNKITDGSLGQNSLGSQPVGSILNLSQGTTNPKFRVINTFPRQNCFERQIVYSSNDVDQQWELLRFGPSTSAADDLPVEITI